MAMNLLETVERLQQTLSDAAKASLDRRFGALFDKVYRKDVLWQAWRLVRANNGGPGIDGQTCEYIENEIGESAFLAELRDEFSRLVGAASASSSRVLPRRLLLDPTYVVSVV